MPDARKALGTYVNDHLAGSAAGLELLRFIVGSNPGTELARELEPTIGQLQEERRMLGRLLGRLGVRVDPVRQGVAWAGEKAARVRFARFVTRDADLSRLLELEAMSAGVDGKRCLWWSLLAIEDDHPELAELPLRDLEERARQQRELLERHRLAAARRALQSR